MAARSSRTRFFLLGTLYDFGKGCAHGRREILCLRGHGIGNSLAYILRVSQ